MYWEIWERINWKGFRPRIKKKTHRRLVVGVDSEAYAGKGVLYANGQLTYTKGAGRPFMFAVASAEGSIREVFSADGVRGLFEFLHRLDADIFVFNLKYETGAFLRALRVSAAKMEELRAGKGDWAVEVVRGWEVVVYPGKIFKIRRKGWKKWVKIWDAHNFFNTSLEKAASDFLGEHKIEIDVSQFTHEYVQRNWDDIALYCLKDAEITARLMDKLLKEFERVLGVRPAWHYSPAAWSAQVFSQMGPVENVSGYWKSELGQEVIRMALVAYSGGKFEMRVKGYVPRAFQYDISSAYPAVMATLKAITRSRVAKTVVYQPSADYGFLHVIIEIDPREHGDLPHSVGLWGRYLEPEFVGRKGTLFYPVGRFEAVITKDEYEYLTNAGVKVDILNAYWIWADGGELYRDRVIKLYEMKESSDKWTKYVVKIVLNGFYGKMVQLIEKADGTLEPGLYWHPIHAATITARVRVQLSEIQRTYGDHILAVHTDSVISDIPLPLPTGGIGKWKLEREGEYIGIRSGVYQLGDKVAHQGYIPEIDGRRVGWREILERADPQAEYIYLKQNDVISWALAALKGDPDAVNVFVETEKVLALADDPKRIATERITAGKLLTKRIETKPPIVWRF